MKDIITENSPWQIHPLANSQSTVTGERYRITILTERLIRLEYQGEGRFEDRATQVVINRDFPDVPFEKNETANRLTIRTKHLTITYDKQPFSRDGLSIELPKNNICWHYGEQSENLKGTARTLDDHDGEIPLEDGVLSRDGYSVMDDSRSIIWTAENWVQPPISGHTDLYFWGYGSDYLGCLRDFYHLCGQMPLLPRYALGNWWSRYHEYTQQEYIDLMNRFEKEKIPFSVAVIDMDWHLVDIPEKYGDGWTGYTWNRELFPDHRALLDWLHKKHMKVSLNLHPAEGVRGYEEAYLPMAKALGVDYENETPIPFDVTDPGFMKAYFDILHHPLEDEGVDFWWIDWQQGTESGMDSLDPLWMLNHFHYLDNQRRGYRPMIFSRYAGAGSHRYPIGFSGDAHITWKSLAFQPYFTSTASNIGYGWWSHDIGGHMKGYRDDELALRWVQFGVFSPIMRLHSSKGFFYSKEPWRYNPQVERIMKRFLALRHALIPYLYTMNARFHFEGLPVVQPMYYHYPERKEAYEIKNQYFWGGLLVSPITAKMNPGLQCGCALTWLPNGIWYDIFTGMAYAGEQKIGMFRTLDSIPVLAREGTIVPLQSRQTVSNDTGNPEDLEILIFTGKSGTFTLYEDDGETMAYTRQKHVTTTFRLLWEKEKSLRILPAEGDLSLIPQSRNICLKIYGVDPACIESIHKGGSEISCPEHFDEDRNILTLNLGAVSVTDATVVAFRPQTKPQRNPVERYSYALLNQAQMDFELKDKIYPVIRQAALAQDTSPQSAREQLAALEPGEELAGLLEEFCELMAF